MFRKSVCWEAVVFATDICPYSVFSFVKTITPCHIIAMSRHAVCNLFAIKHQRVPVAPPRGRGMITGQSRVLPMLAIGLSPLLPRHRDVCSWAHVFSTSTYYSHLYTGLWFGRRSLFDVQFVIHIHWCCSPIHLSTASTPSANSSSTLQSHWFNVKTLLSDLQLSRTFPLWTDYRLTVKWKAVRVVILVTYVM